MKQKILSGFAAMVLVSSLSVSLSSHAEPTPSSPEAQEKEFTEVKTSFEETAEQATLETVSYTTAVKVGEYQSETRNDVRSNAAIATIKAHEWNSRQAATLYVRNIPVLTFVEKTSSTPQTPSSNLVKIATVLESSQPLKKPSSDTQSQQKTDPVARATEVAAKLNQLNRYPVDANSIGVRWNEEQQNYSIEIEGQTLVVIDTETILPDTTQNLAEDALQATNRLRRQLGYAAPLSKIEGKSPLHLESAFNRQVIKAIVGWASWYGPGFHGRLTANGEQFNQYELTAAHPSLPFGTTVRVTNTENGRSVVVRINDRGPFTGGRIIDLSVAAAQEIDMINSGVAPVQVEVLAPVQ
ncbi:septal ring lytic transglycosylase RlpA family protein [Limnoraphis robusta Tam1]|uniref:septal ring lytic transglycosylase RlpA family protein n=1 Tax=Limnoraphis robusta TaxID=1118279 RepID=UPI002B1F5B52|nr:septal ring lytic transglycosylase RlpA family protein [Limnoraphis robusta]MEA5538808.1 septal ring lytic transglycosylase RlpA family protein [Limnoraphis robusta Tam1]